MSEQPTNPTDAPTDHKGAFFRARFVGGRFDSHTLPFDVLPDLAAYRNLIVAVAKMLFKQHHDSRVRVPKGFEESFVLGLAAIKDGSAIAEGILIPPQETASYQRSLGFVQYPEFGEARDYVEDLIRRVSKTGEVPDDFPTELAGKFNAFGQNLLQQEAIELAWGTPHPVRYDSTIRRNIVLSRESTYENVVDDFFVLNGFVADTGTIHVRDGSNQALDFRPLTESDFDKAKSRYSERVKLIGTGLFDKADKLRRLLDVQVIYGDDEPEVYEFQQRLDEIATTEAGWFDGDNPSPSAAAVETLRLVLIDIAQSNPEAARPYLYPDPDGGVIAEWDQGSWNFSLTIDIEAQSVHLHATNVETRKTMSSHNRLDEPSVIQTFNNMWRTMSEVANVRR